MDGGQFFMKILFRSSEVLLYFKKLLINKNIVIKEIKQKEGYTIDIKDISKKQLSESFIRIYQTFYLQGQIDKVINEQYFYCTTEEALHINEWVHWLLQDSSFIKNQFYKTSLFDYLSSSLLLQFEKLPIINEYIDYDTFILFQLKSFHEQLIDVVGYAIDEIKREEEHQQFIQKVRNYISLHEPKCEKLHILQANPFQFYSQWGEKYSDTYLQTLMKKEPLYLFGLDESELNLSPILTLLPKQIIIYGTNPSEGKVITLINLYQERITFVHKNQFPFG